MNAPILYWRKGAKQGQSLTPAPFKSEQEFEQTVFDTPSILGDIYLLQRQVRGGAKPGIPDIIGLDSEARVCIIEMKNKEVDASVIPQVLEYAIWAESNPDSVKNLWLEAKDRPEDLTPDWDEYGVRVIVVAPYIDRTTLEHVTKINYPVDLIEVSRWAEGKMSWLLVNKLEPFPARKRVRPVAGLRTYDEAAYEELYNPKSVKGFLAACNAMQQYAIRNGWPVDGKFNKYYFGLKVGNYVVCGVRWIGSKSYGLFFKVPESFAKRKAITGYDMRYEKLWKRATFPTTADKVKMSTFKAFFQNALEQRME